MREPEIARVGATSAAHLPGVAGDDETVARHVERIEIDVERFSQDRIELCVHEDPSLLTCVPILAHPMIFELTGGEVGAETASRTRGNSLRVQDRAEHQRKMTADAGQPMTGIARTRNRPRIELMNASQHLLHRPKMPVVALLFS